jgi:hypothetical protein
MQATKTKSRELHAPPELLNAHATGLAPFYGGNLTGAELDQAIRDSQRRHEDAPAPVPNCHRTSYAAERLDCSIRQIWRLIGSGRLKTVKLGARATRVTDQSLQDVLHGWA